MDNLGIAFVAERKAFYGNDTRKVGEDKYWDDKAYRVYDRELLKGQGEPKTGRSHQYRKIKDGGRNGI